MKRCRRLFLALTLAAGLAGCVRTYRFEQHQVVNSSLNTDGSTSFTSHAEGEERQWRGPWVAPPGTVHP
jgi:hypothetical protein